MAKTAQKSPDLNINLLPNEGPTSTTANAIHWALTAGRYLIILTEIVALSTFLLGIYLSQQKNNLKGSIEGMKNTVDELQTCDPKKLDEFCEDRFLKIQEQIDSVAKIKSAHFETNKVVTEFLCLLPKDMKLEALIVEGEDISFTGKFLTEQELQTMIVNFNTSRTITALDITDLSKDTTKDPFIKMTASALVNTSEFTEDFKPGKDCSI
jgi:hypothetical protein